MTSSGMSCDDLRPILAPIAATAASIEGAFLKAGDALGRGLAVFEQLEAGLSSLSGELDEGAMDSATVSIGRVADELSAFSEHLPRDSATLADLHACSKSVSSRLERLIESMRMMTVLTRSARIEAVIFDTKGAEFVDFTQEIGQLMRHVQAKVATCSREHAKLIDILGAAARAQETMDRDYRSKLLEMASDLQATFATIQDRRRRGVAAAEDLVVRSAEIANAVRTAIMSLQSGDSTRQRLEHVHQGIELAMTPPVTSDEAAEAVDALMCRLQAAQLRDAVVSFEEDVGAIDGSLERLVLDARDLVALGHAIYGDDGSDKSFLHTFGERLSKAAVVIGRCAEARASVGRILVSMRDLIRDLHATISDLNGVIMDVVLIGTNAGLKAGRLGMEGRSLVVIAQELKNTAGAIANEAEGLLPVFETLQTLSRRLDVPAGEAGQGIGQGIGQEVGHDVNTDVAEILGTLKAGGARLASLLASLDRAGQVFAGELVRARGDFARVLGTRGALEDAAADLDGRDWAIGSDLDMEDAARVVDELMIARYTMAREREIHAEILGIRDASDQAAAAASADVGELAGILF